MTGGGAWASRSGGVRATANGAVRATANGGSDQAGADGGDVEKLRKALAAEHAAVFAYGLLGARTSGALRSRISAAFEAHRARRDRLRAMITTRGGRPAEAEASYALPFVPTGPGQAARLAAQVEAGVAAAYLELAAASDAALREHAALAVQEAATRSYSLRPAPPAAFPGLPPAASPTGSPPASTGLPTGPSPGPQDGTQSTATTPTG
uniref:ferritin-like domain-containing protein n=1 Tax=Nonomuraea pusilla TaxID=46177 RepID=UPI000B04BF11|nr:ferritin-like domain-containing protein [Nonomuraea pusilla]